ncbi:MAG TPA: zinc ribbon domain-containing protein [Chthoniobacterales bacterium]|nr:zinc ribbon domain-containing protein [Chthoniobacterales bacterium]
MTKLICPECQHENEPERIYCHNCGARLDRSALAAADKPAQEGATQAHQRLRKMFDPDRGKLRRRFFGACKLILAACVTAAIVEMILPPDVPAPANTVGLATQINFDLENAELYHRPPQLQYTQDQVNAYLGFTLKSKQKSLDRPLLDFRHAFVAFHEGACNITVERSLYGYSLYSRASYRVAVNEGKIAASNNGGWIGRLPIYPQLMQVADIIFADLWSALDRERKLVAKMAGIELHDGSVTLTTPSQ